MSEELERVRDVKFLPLFPLPIVLLPYELLPLHIFELRYRQMLNDVQLGDKLFGLSFFDSQNSLSDTPEIGSYGCAAEVRNVQTLDDGRSNILTFGLVRYRLESYVETGEPYLVGEVSFFEDEDNENETETQQVADEVFRLFVRIGTAAHELSGERGRFPDLSQAPPQQLSFLIAAAFNLEAKLKLDYLKMRSTLQRLERLRIILGDMVERIEENAALGKIAKTNGHSTKKIDLD